MKTRVMVGVVGIPVIILIILFAPMGLLGLVLGAVAAVAAWELMRCFDPDVPRRLVSYAAVGAVLLPLFAGFGMSDLGERLVLWALLLVMFCELMVTFRDGEPMDFVPVLQVLFAGFVVPMLFASLVRMGWMHEHGTIYLFMPFVAAFSSDSGAYFAGLYLGKHKLAPHLSPKKTIEGSAGGFVAAIVVMLAYGLVLRACGFSVDFLVLGIYGFFGSLAGQIGDLAFSAIKRLSGIKDYSHVIPGHGGVLDRFDSVLFIAPLFELLLMWVPAVV